MPAVPGGAAVTRTYKRKRWGSKERRVEAAARLRAEGLSLRQIGERLKVHHDTVWRDLKRWDAMAKVSELPVGKASPTGSNPTADPTADQTPLPQVIQLAERRRA